MFADIAVEHELKGRIAELRERAAIIRPGEPKVAAELERIARSWATYHGLEEQTAEERDAEDLASDTLAYAATHGSCACDACRRLLAGRFLAERARGAEEARRADCAAVCPWCGEGRELRTSSIGQRHHVRDDGACTECRAFQIHALEEGR
jgi:hypothetical protein